MRRELSIVPQAVRYAEVAYKEPQNLTSFSNCILPLCGSSQAKAQKCFLHGAEDFVPITTKMDSAYVVRYDTHTVIVFRGTEGRDAWRSNIDVWPLRSSDCHITSDHIFFDGFYTSWLDYKLTIDYLIKDRIIKSPVYIFSHSRGGPHNRICARHMVKNRGFKNISSLSFSSPAEGTKAHRDSFNIMPINSTNIYIVGDIVVRMPPKAIGARHAGKQVPLKPLLWFHHLPFWTVYKHRVWNVRKVVDRTWKLF